MEDVSTCVGVCCWRGTRGVGVFIGRLLVFDGTNCDRDFCCFIDAGKRVTWRFSRRLFRSVDCNDVVNCQFGVRLMYAPTTPAIVPVIVKTLLKNGLVISPQHQKTCVGLGSSQYSHQFPRMDASDETAGTSTGRPRTLAADNVPT